MNNRGFGLCPEVLSITLHFWAKVQNSHYFFMKWLARSATVAVDDLDPDLPTRSTTSISATSPGINSGLMAGLLPRFSWLITRLCLPLILLAIYLLLSILNANSRTYPPTLESTLPLGSIISGN